MPDEPVCDRCGRPAVQQGDRWVHAEFADSVFCDLVMRAPERLAAAEAADDQKKRWQQALAAKARDDRNKRGKRPGKPITGIRVPPP